MTQLVLQAVQHANSDISQTLQQARHARAAQLDIMLKPQAAQPASNVWQDMYQDLMLHFAHLANQAILQIQKV